MATVPRGTMRDQSVPTTAAVVVGFIDSPLVQYILIVISNVL